MALDKRALQAYCDNVGHQMIAYCKHNQGRPPEVVIPFVIDPIPALKAYEEAKPERDLEKATQLLKECLQMWEDDGVAIPHFQCRIERAIDYIERVEDKAA